MCCACLPFDRVIESWGLRAQGMLGGAPGAPAAGQSLRVWAEPCEAEEFLQAPSPTHIMRTTGL